ncbi:MAG: NigD-like protein [Prevotella sp.]|jgi:hypothetical protein|nr:NigD-like protein [Prevotella sp.]
MKLLLGLILISTITLGYSSCSDDIDPVDNYWASLVTINEIGGNSYDFTLDNGKKLWVKYPADLNLNPKYERGIIYYTVLEEQKEGYEHTIQLYRFYDVLTKGAIYIAEDDKVKQDSIGYDPIKVHSMWEAAGFLNISFGYNAGGNAAHMLNLISNEEDLSVNKDVVKLEFRHNQSGDPQYYPADGYVSFDLTPYQTEGRDKVTFEITWKDFGGQIKTKEVEYKYGSAATQAKTYTTLPEDITNLNIY